MSVLVETCAGWLRRNLAWSNSRQSWQERIGFVVLLGMAGGLWWLHARLSLVQQVLLWAVLVLALAILLRRGWVKLFGPVLFYDMVRTARRSRYFAIRLGYALLLMFMLWSVYLERGARVGGAAPRPRQLAELTESFFFTFMGVQFMMVALLTPAYAAGAIADEKERKTLPFLLATDLRNREIVFGKLVARLANLALIVLTGLPILALLQFVGGIDPDLLLSGFAVTGLTMISLAALSILSSVYARKPRDAIVLTYLAGAGYLLLSLLAWLQIPSSVAAWPLLPGHQSPTVKDVIDWFGAGNPFLWLSQLGTAYGSGRSLGNQLWGLLGGYAIFHGLVALLCTAWAVVRLRAVALREASRPVRKGLAARLWPRPRVGPRPMVWKEIHVEAGPRLHWMGRILVVLLVLASFVPAIWIIVENSESGGYNPWRILHQEMNIFIRIVGTLVACLMLLGVAVRASGSVSGERDRQTLDELLTTPLGSDAILYGKWLGSVLSARWSGLWVGSLWALGVLSEGLHPLAVPLLVGAWLVFATFLASLGLWFSVISRTTTRATIWTLLTAAGLGVGHWLIWLCCGPLLAVGGGSGFRLVMEFQAFGLTPPLTLGLFAFQGQELEEARAARRFERYSGDCGLRRARAVPLDAGGNPSVERGPCSFPVDDRPDQRRPEGRRDTAVPGASARGRARDAGGAGMMDYAYLMQLTS